jgi:hypothetical protein
VEDTYKDRKTGESVPFTYAEYTYPEAGEARYIASEDWDGGFVVEINGRNYRVDIHLDADDGIPGRASVIFTRTDAPATPTKSWDHAEAVRQRRAQAVERLASAEKELAENEDAEWVEYLRDDVTRAKREIERYDSPTVRIQHPFYAQVFGQPIFIQNAIYPVYNGRMAMALVSVEAGWGDSGNYNVMFACDENGVPCRAWFEASCC